MSAYLEAALQTEAQMTQSKHTPTPWGGGNYSSVVGVGITASASGKVICKFPTITPNAIDPKLPGDAAFNRESEANAKYVIKCVNAHDDLVAALKVCEKVMSDAVLYSEILGDQPEENSALAIVRSALSKARGESV